MLPQCATQFLRIIPILKGSVFTLILLLIAIPDLQAQYSETLYGLKEGITHPVVKDICTDNYGFIWVLTAKGVCRFDGYRFKEYKREWENRRMSLTTQTWFMEDSKNRLWLKSNFGGTYLYEPSRDRIVLGDTSMHDMLFDMVDDNDGNYLVSGVHKLFQFHKKSDIDFTAKEYAMPKETGQFLFMHRYEDGSIILTAEKGLFGVSISGDSLNFRAIRLKDPETGSEYMVDAETRILAADERLYLLNEHEILCTNLPVSCSFSDSVVNARVLDMDFPKIGLQQGQRIHAVVKGEENELYIRAHNGIYRYYVLQETAERIKIENYGETDAAEGYFRSALFYTADGILWAGTDKGLLKIVPGNKAFNNILPEPDNPEGLRVGKLNQVLIDSKDHLWIGTVSDGLYHSEPEDNGEYRKFRNFLPDPSDPLSIHDGYVKTLFEDSQNRLWVGGNNLQWMDLNNKHGVFNYTHASLYAVKLGQNLFPFNIAEDPDGNLLIAARGSLPSWLIPPTLNEAYALTFDSARQYFKWPYFCMKDNDELYFINNATLFETKAQWVLVEADSIYTAEGAKKTAYFHNDMQVPWAYPADLNTLLHIDSLKVFISTMLITQFGRGKEVWLAIEQLDRLINCNLDSLRKDLNPDFRIYPAESKDNPNYVFELLEDKNGNIWSTTRNGLVYINPLNRESYTYYMDDGLPSSRFYWGADVAEDGMIYLCTTNGLVYFDPDSISPDPPPRVLLTDFEFFHNPVEPGPDSFLKESIMSCSSITLKHNQNFIGFRFAALAYRNSGDTWFKYKLEGLDRDWISADERRLAEYPNLQPGKYTFRVIAANGNGVWNKTGTSIDIWIQRPIWFRWWAFLIDFILLLSMISAYIRFRERNLKREAKRLERKVEDKTHEILEQRKELDNLKSRFYANISHEFRTPLTLLAGPLEDAVKVPKEDVVMKKGMLRIMLRNARRLQRLINQLLDISKFESGNIQLQLVKGNLSGFVNAISGSFHSLADSRRISYNIKVEEAPDEVCFDPDKTEKIIINLLSNAFKFTPEGESVSLKLNYQASCNDDGVLDAYIEIKDTGKGIDEEQLGRIFERFYQVSDSDTREVEGTGIGLALTKEMTDLIKGKISVESKLGIGTIFKLTFPVSEQCFAGNKIGSFYSSRSLLSEIDIGAEDELEDRVIEGGNEPGDKNKKLILIVEDNADLRKYIRDQLEHVFRIEEAENGKSGLEKTKKMLPDLVITDLMMPEMGGIEMCDKLKNHPATNHIPVIMLTAKADKESRMTGLETGADDYIIKPFDAGELRQRARNLIQQREMLWKIFQSKYLLEDDGDDGDESSLQFKMLRTLISVIDRHLENPDFGLKILGEELNVSRSQLYRKIHNITGNTPNELIRMVRMKRAARLIRAGELNVTQIMYSVGLKNPSYFALSFKKYYGVNPSMFRNS